MFFTLAYSWRLFIKLTWTHFKLRYYGSYLGYFWSLLKPMGLFAVFYLVFTMLMKKNTPHYGVFLLLGIILWDFFVTGTIAGMHSLLANAHIMRKHHFPWILCVIAAVSSTFIGFFFNLLIFFFFCFLDGVRLTSKAFYFIPMTMALYMIVLGIGLFLSIMVVKVRDTLSLWEVVTQWGFWATPVIYPIKMIPAKWCFLLFINPMTGIIVYSRYVLMGIGKITHLGYCYVIASSLIICLLGMIMFKINQEKCVEIL